MGIHLPGGDDEQIQQRRRLRGRPEKAGEVLAQPERTRLQGVRCRFRPARTGRQGRLLGETHGRRLVPAGGSSVARRAGSATAASASSEPCQNRRWNAVRTVRGACADTREGTGGTRPFLSSNNGSAKKFVERIRFQRSNSDGFKEASRKCLRGASLIRIGVSTKIVEVPDS